MDASHLYESGGDLLKASDLQGKEVPVKIDHCEVIELGNDKKLCVFFAGKEKGVALNKTNYTRLEGAFGRDTDGWIGKQVVLYSELVEFNGQQVQGLRVRIPAPMATDDQEVPF